VLAPVGEELADVARGAQPGHVHLPDAGLDKLPHIGCPQIEVVGAVRLDR
jgi:hypothetical protein